MCAQRQVNNCIAPRTAHTHPVDYELLSMPRSDTHGSSDGIEVAHLGGCLDYLTPSVQVDMGLDIVWPLWGAVWRYFSKAVKYYNHVPKLLEMEIKEKIRDLCKDLAKRTVIAALLSQQKHKSNTNCNRWGRVSYVPAHPWVPICMERHSRLLSPSSEMHLNKDGWLLCKHSFQTNPLACWPSFPISFEAKQPETDDIYSMAPF